MGALRGEGRFGIHDHTVLSCDTSKCVVLQGLEYFCEKRDISRGWLTAARRMADCYQEDGLLLAGGWLTAARRMADCYQEDG